MGADNLIGWYDELIFFIHPSAAILTQSSFGGLQKAIDFGVWAAGCVYLESVLKVAERLDVPVEVQAEAVAILERA